MMKRKLLSVAVLVVAAAPVFAQSSQCPGSTNPLSAAQISQDACQQAIDLFQYMAPQLGAAITGGNATLGQGGTLGGIGHFSIGVRVNAVAGSLPQVTQLPPRSTGASPSRQFPTKDSPVPMPTADAAIGIFKGIPIGLTNVGGIDALVSAMYIPKVDQDQVKIDPDNPLKIGYGVRIGALSESIVVPGVAITYLKRDLPVLTMTGTSGGSTLTVSNFNVKTSAWRVVASKSFILFGLAAGFGQDMYESSASAQATTNSQTSSSIAVSQKDLTRTNVFGDVSLDLPLLKIIGEVGQVSGGTAPTTFNSFQGKGIVDSRLYGSVGLRLGW
jgi:hypothetical protein